MKQADSFVKQRKDNVVYKFITAPSSAADTCIGRSRLLYAYPSSSSSSRSSSPEGRPAQTQKPIPLSQRLRALQTELTALEHELADPSNPLLHKEREESVDPGELIKGLVDVRGRLDKIRKDKEGRGKL